MKLNKILLFALTSIMASNVFATKGVDAGTKYGSGQDSIRCIQNLSIYRPYMKQGDFANAVKFWEICFRECPAASINLYVDGVKIRKWQLKNAKTAEEKKAAFDGLMEVYDGRIKYFGEDPKYHGAEYAEGLKGYDYAIYNKKGDMNIPYKLLGNSLKGKYVMPHFASTYLTISYNLLQKHPERKEIFINDYLKASKAIDDQIKMTKSPRNIKIYSSYKPKLDLIFSKAGVADCNTLDSIFADKVEVNKANLVYLKNVLNVFKRTKCRDTKAYLQASKYSYAIEPTADAAEGLAEQSVKNKDFDTAAKYLDEAIGLEKDNNKKAEISFFKANVLNAQKKYSAARSAAYDAVKLNPNYGEPYILIGKMYANTIKSVYPNDQVLQRAIYWAAVDKLVKAKSVDPSCAAHANKFINNYVKQYPSKEDVFMHPKLNVGKPFKIGGWIGETVICR